jgi:hypothetical protein
MVTGGPPQALSGHRGSVLVVVRALAITAVVLAVLIGTPAVLVLAIGNPLPAAVPSWEEIRLAVEQGQLEQGAVVDLLAVVAWLAWGIVLSGFLTELPAAVRGGTARAVAGLSVGQWMAKRVVAGWTLAASVLFQTAAAGAPAAVLPPLIPMAQLGIETDDAEGISSRLAEEVTTGYEEEVGAGVATATTGVPSGDTIGVGRHDTLWSLAETHLGSGERWVELRDANVGRVMDDGTVLATGFTRVEQGWDLVIPVGDGSPSPPEAPVPGPVDLATAAEKLGLVEPAMTGEAIEIDDPADHGAPSLQLDQAVEAAETAESGPAGTEEAAETLQTVGSRVASGEGTADTPAGAVGTWGTQVGDHFWSIAEETLTASFGREPTEAETRAYWVKLVEANEGRLVEVGNPDLILPGQGFDVIMPSLLDGTAPDLSALAGLDQFTPAGITPEAPADEPDPAVPDGGGADDGADAGTGTEPSGPGPATPGAADPGQSDDQPDPAEAAATVLGQVERAPVEPDQPPDTVPSSTVPPSTVPPSTVPPSTVPPSTAPPATEAPPVEQPDLDQPISDGTATGDDAIDEDTPMEPAVSTTAISGESSSVPVAQVALGVLGVAVAAGAFLGVLRAGRRVLAARRQPGTEVEPVPEPLARFEADLRPVAAADTARWVEATNRFLTHQLARNPEVPPPAVLAVRAGDLGVEVLLATPAVPVVDGFVDGALIETTDGGRMGPTGAAWLLDPTVELNQMEAEAGAAVPYCPALLPVGATPMGDLLIDVEQLGVAAVTGRPDLTAGWLQSLVLAAAATEWSRGSAVLAIGLDAALADLPNVVVIDESMAGLADVVEPGDLDADPEGGGEPAAPATGASGATSYEQRVSGGQPAPPTLVVVGPGNDEVARHLVGLVESGELPVVLLAAAPLATASRFAITEAAGFLEPLGLDFVPAFTSGDTIRSAAGLMQQVGADQRDPISRLDRNRSRSSADASDQARGPEDNGTAAPPVAEAPAATGEHDEAGLAGIDLVGVDLAGIDPGDIEDRSANEPEPLFGTGAG